MLTVNPKGGGYVHPDDPGEATGQPRISITDDEAELLTQFAYRRDVLEIGTGLGVSTRALAKDAKSVTTVDPDPWVHQNIWPDLAALGVLTADTLPGRSFDLVFIDGDHSKDAVDRDIGYAFRVVQETGGLVIGHDAHALAGHFGAPWLIIPTHYGLAIRAVPADGF